MSLGVGTRKADRHVGIHELNLRRTVVRAVCSQLNLQPLYGLKLELDIELVAFRPHCRRRLAVVGNQPAALLGFVDIVVVHESEGEIQSRRHGAVVGALAEYIADFITEKRNGQSVGALPANGDVARTHCQTQRVFADVAP